MTQQDDKTTMQTNLEWHSATLVEILREQPNAMKGNGGIYIWEHRGKPIYVGKATRKTGLWKRQLQWYFMQINGQSRLPENFSNEFSEGWEFKAEPKQVEQILNKNEYLKLLGFAFDFAHEINVYWAQYEHDDQLSNIERTILCFLNTPTHRPWQNSQFFAPTVSSMCLVNKSGPDYLGEKLYYPCQLTKTP